MRRAGVKLVLRHRPARQPVHAASVASSRCAREVYTPLELLRQATSNAAEMMMQRGQIGCVAEGAHADLLVVDGDPLADIGLVAADGAKLRAIVRGGRWSRTC